jgi:hypothetical protein
MVTKTPVHFIDPDAGAQEDQDTGAQEEQNVSYEYIPPPTITTALDPNPKILQTTARIARDLTLVCGKPGDPEPYIYGHGFSKPMVIGADDSGEYLVLDLLWSVGEIDSYAGSAIWFDATNIGLVSGGLHEHFLGTSGQSASTIMTALKGSYAAYPDKAHSVISMQDGWNLNMQRSGYWRKIPDPRLSPVTPEWSQNPALILSDILTLCGYSVDAGSLADAANYCDEPTDSWSPFGESPRVKNKRWEIIAEIRDRHSLHHWVHTLAQYCNCFVDEIGGSVILTPDKPRASNHTVSQSDMIDSTVRVNYAGARKTPSAVSVIYGGRGFLRPIEMTYPVGSAGDGSGTISQLQMPFWRRPWGAERKAEEVYRKAQTDLTLEYTGFDDGLLRTVGDVGTITNTDYGLTAKEMILTENNPVSRGRWKRRYTEYSQNNYTDADTGEPDEIDTTLFNPYSPPPGPIPTLTYDLVTTDSPNWTRIKIDFSPQTWAYLKDYYITVTTTTDTDTILYSEFIGNAAATGSPALITTYTDVAASLGDSPQTVYRVNVYIRSIVVNWDGADVLSTLPGTATITDPVGLTVTAKHFNTDSPGNYYVKENSSSPKPYGGLINATGSGDTYDDMTLVFCIYIVDHSDGDIFADVGYGFYLSCTDTEGTFLLGGENWDATLNSLTLSPTGSPTDGGIWPAGAWHAFMISLATVDGVSKTVDVWVDGVEEHSGNFTTGTTKSFRPMGWDSDGDMLVGNGDNWPNVNCYMSYVYCAEEYLDPNTKWDTFFDGDNKPKNIGTDGSDASGTQPDTYCPDGDFTNNLGSGPNWTEVGTVPDAPSSPSD